MSTIEDIIKIERDTASQLKTAKNEAEKIKTAAREDAAEIIDAAKAERKVQSEKIFNQTDAQTSIYEKEAMGKLNEKLERGELLFNKQTGNVADWIVEQIIG